MLLNSQLQIKPGLSNHDAKRVVENLFEIQVIDVKVCINDIKIINREL